jgi:hypothetical protein
LGGGDWQSGDVIEVRRESDGELCGHVRPLGDRWQALTVFGGDLGILGHQKEAEARVHQVGLSSLAERWWYRADESADWQVVCVQEASPHSVRLALDYYSMPGVPTVTVTREELESGVSLVLTRDEPA